MTRAPVPVSSAIHRCRIAVVAGILACALLIAGCTAPALNPAAGQSPVTVSITASPPKYSPVMSSTVGIGLTANISGADPESVLLTWNATQGKFLGWSAPDFTVTDLGNPVTVAGNRTVFWSFDLDGGMQAGEPVTVILSVKDAKSGTLLTGSTLTLGWEGNITVVVQGATPAVIPVQLPSASANHY